MLPPAVYDQAGQVERVMANVRRLSSPLEKHSHLIALQERNERLFYRVLLRRSVLLAPCDQRAIRGTQMALRGSGNDIVNNPG